MFGGGGGGGVSPLCLHCVSVTLCCPASPSHLIHVSRNERFPPLSSLCLAFFLSRSHLHGRLESPIAWSWAIVARRQTRRQNFGLSNTRTGSFSNVDAINQLRTREKLQLNSGDIVLCNVSSVRHAAAVSPVLTHRARWRWWGGGCLRAR